MKPLQLIFFLLCFGISLSSCRLFGGCEDDKLEMSQTGYEGNSLNLDGYYFGEKDDKSYMNIFYLYQNGVVFAPGAIAVTIAESGIPVERWNSESVKWEFGLYKIDGNRIIIERWHPSHCGAQVFFETGEILNDTSFIIKTREAREKGKVSSVNEINSTFYFRQGEKPDSTNNYIN